MLRSLEAIRRIDSYWNQNSLFACILRMSQIIIVIVISINIPGIILKEITSYLSTDSVNIRFVGYRFEFSHRPHFCYCLLINNISYLKTIYRNVCNLASYNILFLIQWWLSLSDWKLTKLLLWTHVFYTIIKRFVTCYHALFQEHINQLWRIISGRGPI
jgi:hypothetical protein